MTAHDMVQIHVITETYLPVDWIQTLDRVADGQKPGREVEANEEQLLVAHGPVLDHVGEGRRRAQDVVKLLVGQLLREFQEAVVGKGDSLAASVGQGHLPDAALHRQKAAPLRARRETLDDKKLPFLVKRVGNFHQAACRLDLGVHCELFRTSVPVLPQERRQDGAPASGVDVQVALQQTSVEKMDPGYDAISAPRRVTSLEVDQGVLQDGNLVAALAIDTVPHALLQERSADPQTPKVGFEVWIPTLVIKVVYVLCKVQVDSAEGHDLVVEPRQQLFEREGPAGSQLAGLTRLGHTAAPRH